MNRQLFATLRGIINNTNLGPLDRFKLMCTAYHIAAGK